MSSVQNERVNIERTSAAISNVVDNVSDNKLAVSNVKVVSNDSKDSKNTKKEDYCEEFVNLLPKNQLYGLFIFINVAEHSNANLRCMMNCLGVFGSLDEANKRMGELKSNPKLKVYNIYIAELGKFAGMLDDPSLAENEEYHEAEQQKLMKNYKENRSKVDLMEKQYRQDLLDQSVREAEAELKKNPTTKERLQNKLNNRHLDDDETKKNSSKDVKVLEPTKELEEKKKSMNKKDDKLAKLRKMAENMSK